MGESRKGDFWPEPGDLRGCCRVRFGQSFAFVARPISGGSERRYRPFGENGSAAHGSRLRARFLVFHTDRWESVSVITWKRPFGHVKAVHTIKRPFVCDNKSRRPHRRCERAGNAPQIALGGRGAC